ncbi:hypothetical protein ACFV13_12075 [Streptomyces bauhiniae]|uniref:hypothetical protein n=1 Tax=Streptomyces bauhiniae TaxID=2340725 RepID=UPI0036921A92
MDAADLNTLARTMTAPADYELSRTVMPERRLNSVKFRIRSSKRRVNAAKFRAYDAQTAVARRQAERIITEGMLPPGQKLVVGELKQILLDTSPRRSRHDRPHGCGVRLTYAPNSARQTEPTWTADTSASGRSKPSPWRSCGNEELPSYPPPPDRGCPGSRHGEQHRKCPCTGETNRGDDSIVDAGRRIVDTCLYYQKAIPLAASK